MDVKRYCVNDKYTIKEVLEQFESYNNRVAIVTSVSNRIIYTHQPDYQKFVFAFIQKRYGQSVSHFQEDLNQLAACD